MVEQTKTNPQETLEVKLDKKMESFSLSPAIKFSEEGKLLLAVKYFEATNSVFNITDEKNTFSTSAPSQSWSSRGSAETINKLQILVELRLQSDIKLHVEKIRKIGNQIKLGQRISII